MADPVKEPKNHPIGRPSAYSLLAGLGIASLVLMLTAGLLRMIGGSGANASQHINDVGVLALYLAIGLASAGFLLGVSVILRALRDLHAALIRVERYQYEIGSAPPTAPTPAPGLPVPNPGDDTLVDLPPQPPDAGVAPWGEIIRLLEELRDNSLLTDAERQEKRHQSAEREMQHAQNSVAAHLADGDYGRARQAAESVRTKYPDDPRTVRLVEQLESTREQHEAQDVGSITKQVEDLMSISAWQRARQLAQQLQQRHPDSVDARNLVLRIEREHKIFQEEQQRRMSAEIQRFVSRRRWEEALAAARTFVERFPGCVESEALLLQIPTLESNAEIEHRQQLEAEIMDLVRHGRYIEAAELARRMIEKYPDSPQADALRSQLGRLEQLANNPSAPPARVRVD